MRAWAAAGQVHQAGDVLDAQRGRGGVWLLAANGPGSPWITRDPNSVDQLKLKQAPDKTFIGRIARGFDFLGYQFSTPPQRLAAKTLTKHVARWHRLYERQPRKAAPAGAAVLDAYVLRWQRWCSAGLDGLRDVCAGTATPLGPGQGGAGQA